MLYSQKMTMSSYNAVVYDVEATPGSTNGESRIHTICLIPVTVNAKTRTVARQKGVLICVRDVIRREEVHLKTDVKIKLAQSLIDVANYGMDIKYLNFYDAIAFMNIFVTSHGAMLIGHNIIGDLDFISSTQKFVGGKRIVKKKFREYPDTGMYDKNWKSIAKVCTMSLFANRCPKMNEKFSQFIKDNEIPLTHGGYAPLRLCTYTQFVTNDIAYKQAHTAVQDTIDLISVLKAAIEIDGPAIMDGYSYMVKPEWFKP